MTELYVTWDEYHRLIEQLGIQLRDSGWKFNQIICIARGGLRVGDILSRVFKLPLAILSTHSYLGQKANVRGELAIATHLTMTSAKLGDRVILVDDMVDSGHTMKAVYEELRQRYSEITEMRTAVLWYKACSLFRPDFYVRYLRDSPWIHQPFEGYDRMDAADLKSE